MQYSYSANTSLMSAVMTPNQRPRQGPRSGVVVVGIVAVGWASITI